jgi:hypothetical protein
MSICDNEQDSEIAGYLSDIQSLRQQLAAAEVQRDAALAACRFAVNHHVKLSIDLHGFGETKDCSCSGCRELKAALSLTPAHAAVVVEERDQLKKILGRALALYEIRVDIANKLQITAPNLETWVLDARQALAGPAKGENQ